MECKAIDVEIAKLEQELANVKGTECEVYARIVGYYRPIKNWNAGKKAENDIRRLFSCSSCSPSPIV